MSTALLDCCFYSYGKAMLTSAAPMKARIEWLLARVERAEVMRVTGASKSAVSEWKRTGRIDKKHLPALAKLSGTRAEWWLDPKAPVPPDPEWLAGAFRSRPLSQGLTALDTERVPYGEDAQRVVPMLDVRASAGLGVTQPDHDPILGTLRLNVPWMQRHLRSITSPDNLACLFAYGPSMEPTFSDGSILLVDTGVRDVKVDAIYVLQREDELYVKRVQRRMTDGALLIISDNPHYQPEALTADGKHSMQVLGRVVWAFDSKGV